MHGKPTGFLMTLPTPKQLEELSKLIVKHGQETKGKWYRYDEMLRALEDSRSGKIVGKAADRAKSAVTKGAGALGVSTGSNVVPFGAVLAPWIAVADIAHRSGTIFELHDLKEQALSNTTHLQYYCKCGKCFENIKYVVDKKERNVGRIAVGAFTLGLSTVATTAHSIYKSFQSNRPKEMVSRGLVNSARGGCTVAMATIFLLSGDWKFLRGGNAGIMRRATAIITSQDGWEKLKDAW